MNKFKKQSVEVVEEVVVVETTLSNKELIAQAIAKLSPEELALIYPPIERQNFVVRKNWLGRNQIITFVNDKGMRVTYDHDVVLKLMEPRLNIMPCWQKRGYWSQSTDMPLTVRHAVIERVAADPEK